jgi:dihydroorotase
VDVGVESGRIAAIAGRGLLSGPRLELGGLDILPGVIDSQVHFREPGLTHKEDLATGSAAAALGGVTAFCEMPNTRPSTTTAADLQHKLDLARGRAWVDHAFFVGASAENAGQLGELEQLPGCAGVKIFMGSSTGSLLVADDQTLAEVLGHGRRRVAVHCEDEPRLLERRPLATGHPRRHPIWRDELSALRATERLLAAARRRGRPVHVLHVTTAEEMELLGHHKDLATVSRRSTCGSGPPTATSSSAPWRR